MQRAAKSFVRAAGKTWRATSTQVLRAAREDIRKNVRPSSLAEIDVSPTLIAGGAIVGYGAGLWSARDYPEDVYALSATGIFVGAFAGLAYPVTALVLPLGAIAFVYKHGVAQRRFLKKHPWRK